MMDSFSTQRAIHGDLAAVANARNRAGAIAGTARANTTSDYNNYMAAQLQASAYGNDMITQGYDKDRAEIKASGERAVAEQDKNAERRWQAMETNKKTLDAYLNAKTEFENSKTKQRYNALSKYASERND